MTDTDFAWLAGFIDGEGYFYSRRMKSTYLMRCGLVLTQKHPEVLHRAHKIIGKGSVNGPYTYGRNTSYRYSLSGYDNVIILCRELWPYLGIRKKRQVNSALAVYRAGAYKPELKGA